MRTVLILLFIISGINIRTYSQNEKKVIAIMPFLSAQHDNRGYAAKLQSTLMPIFKSNSNVTFIDRSADTMVRRELYNQMREESMMSKALVPQGMLSGSTEIIVGVLTVASAEEKNTESLLGKSSKKYAGRVSFSLQIADAATGVIKSVKNFEGTTNAADAGNRMLGSGLFSTTMADTKDEAISNAMNQTKKAVAQWISSAYPSDIRILSIDKRDKKGKPEQVLVSGLSTDVGAGRIIIVREVQEIDNGDGTKLNRERDIAELKVSEVQGEVTVCKVKKGDDVLEEKMKNPKSLRFTVQ